MAKIRGAMDAGTTAHRYNTDVLDNGRYVYTSPTIYSAVAATDKQTHEIHAMIRRHFNPNTLRILDIGCGDGTFSIQMFTSLRPKQLIGFDIATEGVRIASRNSASLGSGIRFSVGDIYAAGRKFGKDRFPLAVLRGVLHHLDDPERAIGQLRHFADHVLFLEPNGYNPILKFIERTSRYHLEHGEKSYFPPALHSWFAGAGYVPVETKYFSIVPYFFPTVPTKLLLGIQPFVESLPYVNRFYCGGILSLMKLA